MRLLARHISSDEDEESVFISMTDMTVGFLFIVLILLAFFASQFRDQDVVNRSEYELVQEILTQEQIIRAELEQQLVDLSADLVEARQQIEDKVAEIRLLEDRVRELEAEIERLGKVDPLETYLSAVARERSRVIQELRESIIVDFPELKDVISAESDALRFQGEGLFASGRRDLRSSMLPVVQRIAERLDSILPCYTLGPRASRSDDCNQSLAVIEAIQIEGHTDTDGGLIYNLGLSTDRAASTFTAMIDRVPMIRDHRNLAQQPVLSIAGYGPDRPIATNGSAEGKASNRRIDLRFIMVTPRSSDEIDRIKAALTEAAEAE